MKSMRRPCFIVGAIVASAMAASPAAAILSSTDLFSGGDGLLTLDSDTNLEWLDLPETLGISVVDVVAGLSGGPLTVASGVLPDGFRFAIKAEVEAIWDSVSGGPFIEGQSTANFGPVTEFLSFTGCTKDVSVDCIPLTPLSEFGHFGIYRTDAFAPTFGETLVAIEGNPDRGRFRIDFVSILGSGDLASPRTQRGQYLVRDAVVIPLPEPTPAALLGLALAVFGLMRWRRDGSPNRHT